MLQENYTISEIIKESELDLSDIIDSGINEGVELAQDDGIDFTLECKFSNGDSSEIELYKKRLLNNKLTEKDSTIINKYKDY